MTRNSLIDKLCDDSTWKDFIQRKVADSKTRKAAAMREFVENGTYRVVVEGIRDGTYEFSPARRIEVPKPGSDDKRVVYTYKRKDITEHMVLRVFADLLQTHDGIFSDNLYSFRNKGGVQGAIAKLRSIEDIGSKYAYKVDITKYFNSIDRDRMIEVLRSTAIDEESCEFMERILKSPLVEFNGELIEDNDRGIMPGLPFSTFLSNLYLDNMDKYFHNKGIQYYRFADDILVLADTENELEGHVRYIRRFIGNKGLEINPSKEVFYKPHERIEFLGLFIEDGIFDINRKSLDRATRRVRVEGRHYRKMVELGQKTVDDAVRCFLARMKTRFFGWKKNPKSCWSSWYFPLINTDASLKVIDHHIQDWVRFIIIGRHRESNRCMVSYKELTKYNYRTLVNRFYNRNFKP